MDRADRRLAQATDQLEQGRLTAPGWPHYPQHLTRFGAEIEPVDHPQLAEGVAHPSDLDSSGSHRARGRARLAAASRRLGGPLELLRLRYGSLGSGAHAPSARITATGSE